MSHNGKRKRYSQTDVSDALAAVKAGSKVVVASRKYGIPYRTLKRKLHVLRNGKKENRPGPKPTLGQDIEKDLHDWIIEMQKNGHPVSRQMILVKGNEMYQNLTRLTRSMGSTLGKGWLERFLGRHPDLLLHKAQIIKQVRKNTTIESLKCPHNEVLKLVIEFKLTADRIFNMDETVFKQSSKSKKVIALSGSRNVWSKAVDTNFHLTFTACVAASGFIVPPLIIVPGKQLNRDVLDECTIPNAKITTAANGFMNSSVFLKWLQHFSDNIPHSVRRPIVLIYDGHGSHHNPTIIQKAIDLKIILVLLPANITHILQPLDVAVFKSFKYCLKECINSYNMIQKGSTSISKKVALRIASDAWDKGIAQKRSNIVSGFKSCGLFPVSLPEMQRRWQLYHDGGVSFQSLIDCKRI